MPPDREALSDRLTRWTILTCPSCGGLVERAITTHLGDCPRRFTAFVAREIEVVQADCEYSAMVAYHQERYDRLRAENEALKAEANTQAEQTVIARAERDRLQAAVDAAHAAMHGSEYVGGPTEREAWKIAMRELGSVVTEHTAQSAGASDEEDAREKTCGSCGGQGCESCHHRGCVPLRETDEMVERGARALYAKHMETTTFFREFEEMRESFERDARTVLDAARASREQGDTK